MTSITSKFHTIVHIYSQIKPRRHQKNHQNHELGNPARVA